MKKFLRFLQKVEDHILVISFVVMVLASFGQVVNRNITHYSISWLEELARYAMVYMALLAAEAGLRDGTQISVTILIDRLNSTARKVLAIVVKFLIIGFSATVFITSFSILGAHLRTGQLSPGLRINMFYPYFALTLSFGIIVIVQTASLVMLFRTSHEAKEASA